MLLALFILGELTSDAADRDAVVRFVFRYFPRQFGFISGQLDAFQTTPVTFGFWGVVALVWASLGVFNAITSAVNHAWAVEKRRSFLKHRLVGFLMMVSAGPGADARPGDRQPGAACRDAAGRSAWCDRRGSTTCRACLRAISPRRC